MKVSQFKQHLHGLTSLNFIKPNQEVVPVHFHVTEIGLHVRHFVDCGGTMRNENKASLQLWVADDVDHRLMPSKLIDLIESSETLFGIESLELEVEYQGLTIERYGIDFAISGFQLISLETDCLAPDRCGIPRSSMEKKKVGLSELGIRSFALTNESTDNTQSSMGCTPGSGCC